MRLIEIWNADLQKSFELFNTFLANENGYENTVFGMDFNQYKQYVSLCNSHAKGEKLREGFVPETKYILEDDNGNYVGSFNLRHYLNEALENGAGHIGYGISEKYRKKGYATEGLRLALLKAKNIGIKEAYLSCNKDNVGSLKAQLKNGGYIHHEDNKEYYVRIKIV